MTLLKQVMLRPKLSLLFAGLVFLAALGGIKIASTVSSNPIQKPSASRSPVSAQAAKETCGDPPDSTANDWYPVFIDGGNLAEIQAKFCKDAIAKTREKTGKATVQLASFSDRSRAEGFARSVKGEVGESYSVTSAAEPSKVAETEPVVPPITQEEPVKVNAASDLSQLGLSEEEQRIARQIPLNHPCFVMTEIYDNNDEFTGKIKNVCDRPISYVSWDVKLFTRDPQDVREKGMVVLSNIEAGEKQPFTIPVLESGLRYHLQNVKMRWIVSTAVP